MKNNTRWFRRSDRTDKARSARRMLSMVIGVTSTADSGPGTLREAIGEANAATQPVEIQFNLNEPATITLTSGQLELSNAEPIAIDGPGAGLLTVSGGGTGRVFLVDSGATASISGLTLTGGSAVSGGGVANYGDLTLAGCTVSDNSAQYTGGGIFNVDQLTLAGCTLSANSSSRFGGALVNLGALALTDCTVSGNTAESSAGLNLLGGTATLVACTVSGNTGTVATSGYVGGMYVRPGVTTTLTGTIVAGNTGPAGASDIGGEGTATGSYDLIGTGGSGGLAGGQNGNRLAARTSDCAGDSTHRILTSVPSSPSRRPSWWSTRGSTESARPWAT